MEAAAPKDRDRGVENEQCRLIGGTLVSAAYWRTTHGNVNVSVVTDFV
jgi:hypothetical protein